MTGGSTGFTRRTAAVALALLGFALAAPAAADDHDPLYAGHPLRIVAYVLHPVGVIIDFLILRPAHWVGNHEPFSTLFGHDEPH